MSADFLLELLSEEIPARMQAKARNDLARLFAEKLGEAGLGHEGITIYSTPRRLALIARGLPEATDAVSEELKGPRTSAPAQALEGFLRKTGLKQDQLEDRDRTWFARIERPGRATSEVLAEAVAAIVRDFPWPKSMRWGAASQSSASLRWVRPLHSIVALLGEEIVPVAIDAVPCGATTRGHRFHHPGPITIGGAHDYVEKLRACHVIVDQEEREATIRKGAAEAAKQAGFALVENEGLVVENAGLTSLPVPLLGSFDPAFLDVPEEVIQLTARINQKYFVMRDKRRKLAPHFVCVANIDAKDGGEAIVAGNERVLAARLSDARFFWEQDLKVPLEDQAEKLAGIVFHEKLGTVADKVERVAKLARWLVEEGIVKSADPDQAERAARLVKADLVTGMVGEFPELQGVIGGHLARAQGEPDAVADAIRDHYKPVGQGDEVPTAPVTVAVSLADKLDSICSFFAIDEKPTGSKDPYALRRASLGVIETIVQNGIRGPIRGLFAEAYRVFSNQLCEENYCIARDLVDDSYWSPLLTDRAAYLDSGKEILVLNDEPPSSAADQDEFGNSVWSPSEIRRRDLVKYEVMGFVDCVNEIAEFFFDRIRDREKREGRRADIVYSVLPPIRMDLKNLVFSFDDFEVSGSDGGRRWASLPNTTANDDIVRILTLSLALQGFISTDDGVNLLAGYKRGANILKKEQWDADAASTSAAEADEQALVDALETAGPHAAEAVEREDFTAAMAALSTLRGPIDAFFDKVTVNDSDKGVRARRLNLLARFRDAVHAVADFSKIEG